MGKGEQHHQGLENSGSAHPNPPPRAARGFPRCFPRYQQLGSAFVASVTFFTRIFCHRLTREEKTLQGR